jgi:xylan 1,4-beta-xylosidase
LVFAQPAERLVEPARTRLARFLLRPKPRRPSASTLQGKGGDLRFFQPRNFKQAAGLIAYYDRLHYHYFRITSCGEGMLKLWVISSENTNASRYEVAELPLAAGEKLFLRMENDFADLRFAWSTDGQQWNTVDRIFEATMLGDWVSPHSNFTGTFWGVCCQDVSNRTAWAHFDYFNYQPIS